MYLKLHLQHFQSRSKVDERSSTVWQPHQHSHIFLEKALWCLPLKESSKLEITIIDKAKLLLQKGKQNSVSLQRRQSKCHLITYVQLSILF